MPGQRVSPATGVRPLGRSRPSHLTLSTRSRRAAFSARWSWLVLIPALGAGLVSRADGQASLRNPTQPILLYQTKGHSGLISSIVFDDAGRMLTAGYDKVIHVWQPSKTRLELVRTIRPPVWRGPRGQIMTMDLVTAIPGEDGERYLAIAGTGLQANYGDISLFKYPGKSNLTTGDQVARLNGANAQDPQAGGHQGQVGAVLFGPMGGYLASGGSDGFVRLWNHAQKFQFAALPGPDPADSKTKSVTKLVFSAKGDRLWVATASGRVRLWDLSNLATPRFLADSGEVLRSGGNLNFPEDLKINDLVLTPDETKLIAGFEDGRLFRVDAATLQQVEYLPESGKRGPVEAIAVSQDGKLATSTIKNVYVSTNNQTPPNPTCVVELRDLQTGAVLANVHEARGRILAMRFSPDGKTLAFAGDVAQSVFLKRFDDGALLEARGDGSSLWDVGFTKTGLTLALSRHRADEPRGPLVTAFDLKTREPKMELIADITHEVRTLGAWRIEAVDQFQLRVTNGNEVYPIVLPKESIRWWDFTFVPEADRPADTPPLVVVGGADGTGYIYAPAIANANNPVLAYINTRRLAGHTASILSVAASADGKWIATGSDDHTVRLWLVKDWKSTPALGIKVEARDGGQVVTEIAPRSFADMMGLQKDDQLKTYRLKIQGNAQFDGNAELNTIDAGVIALWDQMPPGSQLNLTVLRAGKPVQLLTSKQDSNILALFVAENREWVVWTPESYYDTSIKGDRDYLGFHTNGADAAGQIKLDEDTHFFSIDQFETRLRKPKLIDDLVTTADPVRAYAAIPPVDTGKLVEDDKPPGVRLNVGGANARGDATLVVDAPQLNLDVVVDTNGFSTPAKGLKQIRILLDSGPVAVRDFNAPFAAIPPNNQQTFPFQVALKPGLQQVTAQVANEVNVTKPATLLVNYQPKAPLPASIRASELYVITYGLGEFQTPRFSSIPRAENDATELAKFFTNSSVHRYKSTRGGKPTLGKTATLQGLVSALDELETERTSKNLGQGDTVIIAMGTHLVPIDEDVSVLVPWDAQEKDLTKTALNIKQVSERLALLAKSGCQVMLVLDVNHANAVRPARGVTLSKELKEWVRDLYKNRGVNVLVGSLTSPAQVDTFANGTLTRAILASPDPRNWKRVVSAEETMTLGDFKDAVEAWVDRTTESKQIARFYEANVSLAIPFLTPPAANLPVAAK